VVAIAGFLHLNADFPNYSRWMDDSAKFTDEGWWAAGAIRHILTGHWLVEHDYDPMVAVPLWSLVLNAVFRFTGISAAAARGAAFSFSVATVLLCGAMMARRNKDLAPAMMLLAATSPILFFFSRLSVLEPALLFFLMAAALSAFSERPQRVPRLVLCGVFCTLAMLTKTSAIFVAPAIFFLLWRAHRALWNLGGAPRRRAVMGLLIPALTFMVCYGLYWVLVVHRFAVDAHVFYSQNGVTLRLKSIAKAARLVYRCFTWVDAIVFPAAIVAATALGRRLRLLWEDPLFGFAALFFSGYAAFMVLHFDAPPRYFCVLSVPLMMIAVLLLDALRAQMPRAFNVMGGVLLLAVLLNAGYIARRLLHPEYTFENACLQVRKSIAAAGDSEPLVIGHGAIESSLFTQLPALDNLGDRTVDEKMRTMHPGWGVGWTSETEMFETPDVTRDFSIIEVGRYPALDSAARNALLLYRIRPK
jgi:Dolichyl-phosphate-mannose-protein mannosyltransferase